MTDSFDYDVFLTYAKPDVAAVRQLAERLTGDGLRVWLDDWVIQPGDRVPQAIEQGLECSRTLVLVMSEAAFGAEWIRLERQTALFRDPTNQERRFIPVRLDDSNIKDSLRPFAYVDWRIRHEQQQYSRLLKVCRLPAMGSADSASRAPVWPPVTSHEGHRDAVRDVAITPDGRRAASGGSDHSVYAWDISSQRMIASFEGHSETVWCVAISDDGNYVAAGGNDHGLFVWDVDTRQMIGDLVGHYHPIVGVCLPENKQQVISGTQNGVIRIWNIANGECISSIATGCEAIDFSFTPDGKYAGVGTRDGYAQVWDLSSGKSLGSFRCYQGGDVAVALTTDMRRLVVGGFDNSIQLWDVVEGVQEATYEGHTGAIRSVSVTRDTTIVSGSDDGQTIIWDSNGRAIAVLGDPKSVYWRSKEPVWATAISRDGRFAISGGEDVAVRLWDTSACASMHSKTASSRYTNAKVLLVGDSGVGKSGLAIRLTENRFKNTVSTDAHWATQLELPQRSAVKDVEREIWVWDFAGQADYRLIHQLFMDETAAAVLVFNPQSENPFEGLSQWDRDLQRASRRDFAKLLVAGRCDRGGLMLSREPVAEFARQRGFAGYLETSALTGDGCDTLREEIISRIDWDSIPWTASPRIFKLLKNEILRLRDDGVALLRMVELKQQLEMRLTDECFTIDELRAVVGLLASPGLVCKLEFGDIVILKPEWINKYAAAVIRSVRAHIGEIGVIDEAKVLAGDLNYTVDAVHRKAERESEIVHVEMQRLNEADEAIILRAMHQMFVDHGLCVREELEGGGRQLVFPSYFKHELPTDPMHPPALVNYQFEGHAEEIYATLVVQLWRTKAFENGALWRHAADFKSATGSRLGLKMIRHDGKNPEISVYFDSEVQDDSKVTFTKYVHEHLLEKARNVVRLRAYICPHCAHPVRDTQLAREILNDEGANAQIRCQQRDCDKRFSLWDVIEKKFASKEFQKRVRDLEEKAQSAIDNESRELILEGHARVITGEAGQIYRGYAGADHGIDGEIEFKSNAGEASGKRLYIQLKSGDSYLYRRKSDGAEVFQIKKQRWATYWLEQAYPVMLVIRTSDGQIRWMNVTEYLFEKSKRRKTAVKQIIFDGEPFTALNVQRMRDKTFPSSDNDKSFI